MHDLLETLAAPWFTLIDFALATPTAAALATTVMVGVAVVAMLVAVA
jgi:hypothetical protein